MARKFNNFYCNYKRKFKDPIHIVGEIMPKDFSDEFFVEAFKRLYPNLWIDLEKQYDYWHKKNNELIKYGKKSRYNFRKPYNFILDCSYNCRMRLRTNPNRIILNSNQIEELERSIQENSLRKLEDQQNKLSNNLYRIQEIEPSYAKAYISEYFASHDLHERLEIIRELSKYKSDEIVSFFYKVNACTRNFSLKEESMHYIQGLGLPFYLKGKRKGKKSYIDNEKVHNESSPEVLMKRLQIDRLEKLKKFDIFLSHNSKNEEQIVRFYKNINKFGYIVYVDWVNDKFDLRREWCNSTTADVIKKRIEQSSVFVIYVTKDTLSSLWCAWELGYADALRKKICIFLDNVDIKDLPQFFGAIPIIEFDQQEMFILESNNKIPYKNWLHGGENHDNG